MNRFPSARLGLEAFESREVPSASPLRPLPNPDFASVTPRPAVVAETTSHSQHPTGRIAGVVAGPSDSAGIVFVGGWGASMYQYA